MGLIVVAVWPCSAYGQASSQLQATAQRVVKLDGAWNGRMVVNHLQLRVIVKLEKKKGGDGYTGTYQSPDQQDKLFPLDVVTFKSGVLHLEVTSLHLSWDGTFGEAGNDFKGTLKQDRDSVALNLSHEAFVPVYRRPQEPKRPYPYNVEEVSFTNRGSGLKLAGLLTYPKQVGPFPAVLLVSESPFHDHNESVMGHRPFLVLADYLTEHGLAVLRIDGRGIGRSGGLFGRVTPEEYISDIQSSILYLKTRTDIDKKRIGLIGHGEGADMAVIAGTQIKGVALIVMLAGAGVDGGKLLTAQSIGLAKLAGEPDDIVAIIRRIDEKLFASMAVSRDPAKTQEILNTTIFAELQKLSEADRRRVAKQMVTVARWVNSPWTRYFITYDPPQWLKKLTCPVLAINGDKDLQVSSKVNLPAIDAALKAGGNKDSTTKSMPGLNYLFQTCKTGAPSEYVTIEETISPEALKTVGDWIGAHFGNK